MDNGGDSPVVAAAEKIRAELPELLGADSEVTGERLDGLLTAVRSAEPNARAGFEDRVLLLLAEQPPTRERLGELLDEAEELPDEAEAERTLGDGSSYQPLPGTAIVGALGFACSKDDCTYMWPWVDINDTPPRTCPDHGSPLTPIVLGL